jgi:hypothetical protein
MADRIENFKLAEIDPAILQKLAADDILFIDSRQEVL